MVILIDGYNLIFSTFWFSKENSLEKMREELIEKLSEYKNSKKNINKIIVVFDGQKIYNKKDYYLEEQYVKKGIEIIYATENGKADKRIIDLSQKFTNLIIVTEDRKIRKKVRNRGKVLSPEDFISLLIKTKTKENPKKDKILNNKENPNLSPEEIEKWLFFFNYKKEDYNNNYKKEENKVIKKKKKDKIIKKYKRKEENKVIKKKKYTKKITNNIENKIINKNVNNVNNINKWLKLFGLKDEINLPNDEKDIDWDNIDNQIMK